MASFILRKAEPKDVSDILRLIKVSENIYRLYLTNNGTLRPFDGQSNMLSHL